MSALVEQHRSGQALMLAEIITDMTNQEGVRVNRENLFLRPNREGARRIGTRVLYLDRQDAPTTLEVGHGAGINPFIGTMQKTGFQAYWIAEAHQPNNNAPGPFGTNWLLSLEDIGDFVGQTHSAGPMIPTLVPVSSYGGEDVMDAMMAQLKQFATETAVTRSTSPIGAFAVTLPRLTGGTETS